MEKGSFNYPDGTYEGASDLYDWEGYVRVSLTLKNGYITHVEFEETIRDGTVRTPESWPYPWWIEAHEELPKRVLETQNLSVDIVTGASVTSRRFNQAMERVFP